MHKEIRKDFKLMAIPIIALILVAVICLIYWAYALITDQVELYNALVGIMANAGLLMIAYAMRKNEKKALKILEKMELEYEK